MRHLLRVTVAVAIVAITCVPQPAFANSANPPTRFPSQPSTGIIDAGLLCAFPVDLELIGPPQTEMQFFDKSGNVVRATFTGPSYGSLRNVLTNKTVVINISGQGTLVVQSDGSLRASGGGPGLIGLFPTDSGGPALLYIVGHETFTIDQNGAIHNLVITGTVTDLCKVLAT